MERTDSDNIIQIKYNPATGAQEAQALRRRVEAAEPEVTVAMEPVEAAQAMEVRWLLGRRTYVLYLPSDPSVDEVFRRIEGLKNL